MPSEKARPKWTDQWQITRTVSEQVHEVRAVMGKQAVILSSQMSLYEPDGYGSWVPLRVFKEDVPVRMCTFIDKIITVERKFRRLTYCILRFTSRDLSEEEQTRD